MAVKVEQGAVDDAVVATTAAAEDAATLGDDDNDEDPADAQVEFFFEAAGSLRSLSAERSRSLSLLFFLCLRSLSLLRSPSESTDDGLTTPALPSRGLGAHVDEPDAGPQEGCVTIGVKRCSGSPAPDVAVGATGAVAGRGMAAADLVTPLATSAPSAGGVAITWDSAAANLTARFGLGAGGRGLNAGGFCGEAKTALSVVMPPPLSAPA